MIDPDDALDVELSDRELVDIAFQCVSGLMPVQEVAKIYDIDVSDVNAIIEEQRLDALNSYADNFRRLVVDGELERADLLRRHTNLTSKLDRDGLYNPMLADSISLTKGVYLCVSFERELDCKIVEMLDSLRSELEGADAEVTEQFNNATTDTHAAAYH